MDLGSGVADGGGERENEFVYVGVVVILVHPHEGVVEKYVSWKNIMGI